MAKTVLGMFANTTQAESALNRLENQGYRTKDISIVVKDVEKKEELKDTGANVGIGAVSGATGGALLGGLAGLLSSTVIPGLGILFIGGPIATALGLSGTAASIASGAATGAAAGGLLGAFTGWGLSESEARIYQESVQKGGILVAVPAGDDEDGVVTDILNEEGADSVKSFTLKEKEDTRSFEYKAVNEPVSMRKPAQAYAFSKGGRSIRKASKTPRKARVNSVGKDKSAAGSI